MKEKIKGLASDTLIYGVSTIFGRFLTFMLVPFYTNTLSKKANGEIIYIFSALAFLNILYSFGVEAAYFRFFKKDDDKRNRLVFTLAFTTISIISFIVSLLIAGIIPFVDNSLTDISGGKAVLQVAVFIAFFDALMLVPFAKLRMIRKSAKFAVIKFLLVVIAVGLNILFIVVLGWGIWGVIFGQLIASVCGLLMLSPIIISDIKKAWNKSLLIEMLRYGLPTVPANLSSMILQVADRIILKVLLTTGALAIYGINYRLGIPMMLFVTVFEYAWRPFYLSHYEDENAKNMFSRILTYFTMACAAIFLLTSFYMDYAVRIPVFGYHIINSTYWEGLYIIPIILAAYFFNGLFYNLAAGFHITKQTKYLPFAVGAGAALNIALNYMLVPEYGFIAAAWATFAAYFLTAAIVFVISRKIYPINYEWKRLISLVLLTVIIFFAVEEITDSMTMLNGFYVKTGGIIVLIISLLIGKFFTPEEVRLMKKLIKRK